jgi:hypothetical protein
MGDEPGATAVEIDTKAGLAPRRDPEIDQGAKISLGEIP